MKTAKILIIVLIVLLAVRPCFVWMGHQDFDYDEAGQFWMAKGLHHFSEPYAKDGTISDIIENNRHYNLDPGGFTLILRFWLKFSDNIYYLRLLPIIFYFLFIFGMFKIGKLLFNNDLLGLIFASLAVIPNLPIPYFSIPFTIKSGYLRAYSMEMCGVAFSVYYLLKHRDYLAKKHLLALSLLLCFFCTGRYGFVMTAFAISLRVLYLLYTQKRSFKDFLKNAAIYSLPLLATVAVIFFVEARYQNPDANVPEYDTSLFQTPKLLFGWMAVSYYIVLVYTLFYRIYKKSQVNELLILSCIVGAVFMLLSLADKYPWAPTKTAPVMILSMFSLLYIVLSLIFHRSDKRMVAILFATFLLFVNTAAWPTSIKSFETYRKSQKIKEISNLCNNGQTVFVSSGMNPICRHLFEYGALKDIGYPENFSFSPNEKHNPILFDFYLYNPTADYLYPDGFESIGMFTCENNKHYDE